MEENTKTLQRLVNNWLTGTEGDSLVATMQS